MKIIVATHNINKLNEIKKVLKDFKLDLVSLIDLNDDEEIIEDGSSYFENALIKAKTIHTKYKEIVIADDSGLEVEVLNNEPGINSSRYSNQGDYKNNLKVLKLLKNNQNRNARFITVIALYSGSEPVFFEGTLKGRIANEIKGDYGFGYDSIFIPEGYNETLAELKEQVKNEISHRKIALSKLAEYLKTL